MTTTTSQLPVGRPREFDIDEAVRRAIHIFWDRGFHDASLPDLLAGMKLSKGSFYKAFGDKKSVFLRALKLYTDDGVQNVQEVLRSDPSPKVAIRNALVRYADLSSGSKGIRGCFGVLAAAEMLPGDPDIADLIKRLFTRLQDLFATAVAKGQAVGEIKNSSDPRVIAHFIVSHAQGMRVLGKVGSRRDEMLKDIDLLMEAIF
ncbi:MAG: TetR/AcrR family transcriptional regulator [Devosia sp.]|uniref:TetR/AcrR family transcriptional regulator n=1 Tax=Devosia sp. TaxID=1871048 RepID=UPI00339416DC